MHLFQFQNEPRQVIETDTWVRLVSGRGLFVEKKWYL